MDQDKIELNGEIPNGSKGDLLLEDEPKTETDSRKTKRFKIEIFRTWCKSCGICVAFCPRDCLIRDEEGAPQITAPERCIGCGWCEIHCPDFAISVREQNENQGRYEEEEEEEV